MCVLRYGLIAMSVLTGSACVSKELPAAPEPITNSPSARQNSNSSIVDRADASAQLAPTSGNAVTGRLRLTAEDQDVRVVGTVTRLAPNTTHGIHIHENGDCSAPDASSAGEHYNPRNEPHGAPGMNSHLGDLGNLIANRAGVAYIDVVLPGATLDAVDAMSILDKAVIVHALADDLKTQPSGNSGARLACGVITAVSTPR